MSNVLSEAIATSEQELERLKWLVQLRRYDITASKTLQPISPTFDWTATYKIHGEKYIKNGYLVRLPSPEDIEYACQCIRAEKSLTENAVAPAEDKEPVVSDKVYHDPRITTKYMSSEEQSQLCDCPYWGTEFTETD